MRDRMIRAPLMMLVLSMALLIGVVVSVWFAGFPASLKVPVDREHVYHVPFPLSLVVKSDQAGIISRPRSELLQKKGGACTALVVGPNRIGRACVEVRLFGVIPVRQLVINVMAQARVVPSGHAIGVLFAPEGVVIIGHVSIRGVDGREYHPARDAGLEPGDVLVSINGQRIARVADVERVMGEQQTVRTVSLRIRRKGKTIVQEITPVLGSPTSGLRPRAMLGVYIQDSAAGVGTMTFYDPISKRFAALGHMVNEPAPHVTIESGQGRIVGAIISYCDRGRDGEPGEKVGIFRPGDDDELGGTVYKNCRFGIYGKLYRIPPVRVEPVPIALASEVKTGPAEILTVLHGSEVRRFRVRIERVSRQSKPGDKGIVLVITDPELLRITGGIVQGMSGSPIIQNGKLVGAVTHVFVNDPRRGYGVLAEWMWQESVSTQASQAPEQGASSRNETNSLIVIGRSLSARGEVPHDICERLREECLCVGTGRVRVLIADDNADFCSMLADFFRIQPDIDVVGIAHNGLEVVQAVHETRPDLILLDVIMPQFDGLAVLEELKNSGARQGIKVIVLSAFGQETMTRKAVELGADYFIVKPFDLETLVRRVRETVGCGEQVRKFERGISESERQVSRIFSELGIPAHFRGYLYLREAVLMAISDPAIVNGITKKLYPGIASKFNTTRHRVERSMRFAIERAWSTGRVDTLNQYFGFSVDGRKGKPTNACFIAKIADQVRLGLKAG